MRINKLYNKTTSLAIMLMGLLLTWGHVLNARSWYISSSQGLDGNIGTSSAAPKPLSWLMNEFARTSSTGANIAAGDIIYLAKGDRFEGAWVIPSFMTGTLASPILVTSYVKPGGSINDAQPEITIGKKITGSQWTHLGGGVWQTVASVTTNDFIHTVTMDSLPLECSRHPNRGVFSGNNVTGIEDGYLKFWKDGFVESGTLGNTWLENKDTVNFWQGWVGANIVYRPERHVIDRSLITSVSGKRIYFNQKSYYKPEDPRYKNLTEGMGFFFQNTLTALDLVGEWYLYTPSLGGTNAGKLVIKTASTTVAPTVTISTGTVISNSVPGGDVIYARNGWDFNDVQITYAQRDGLRLYGMKWNTITNCTFAYNLNGIYGLTAQETLVDGCVFKYQASNGILNEVSTEDGWNMFSSKFTVTNSFFWKTGIWPGQAGNGDNDNDAIRLMGGDNLVQYNTIFHTGLNCIGFFYGPNNKCLNNYLNEFSLIKMDGGGIYYHNDPGAVRSGIGGDTSIRYEGWEIAYNILLNGRGAPYGTANKEDWSQGIYFDYRVADVYIHNNTVSNVMRGFFTLPTTGHTIVDNLFYNNREAQFDINFSKLEGATGADPSYVQWPMRDLIVKRNQMVKVTSTQEILRLRSAGSLADMLQWGDFNENYLVDAQYTTPSNPTLFRRIYAGSKHGTQAEASLTLTAWRNEMQYELSSQTAPVSFASSLLPEDIYRFEINPSKTAKVITIDRNYIDPTGKLYGVGTYTIDPYKSVVLMPYGGVITSNNTDRDVIFTDNIGRIYMTGGRVAMKRIKSTAQNLWVYSEQLDNSLWNKGGGLVVTPNSSTHIAPDNTTTADVIMESQGVTGNKQISQGIALVKDQEYTISCYVKPLGRNFIQLYGSIGDGGFGTTAWVTFDLSNSTIAAIGGVEVLSTGITNEPNGFTRISMKVKALANTTTACIPGAALLQNGTSGRLPSYAGDATKGAIFWGFSIVKGDLREYVKTEGNPIN